MTDYYLSTAEYIGENHSKYLKNTTIYDARIKARGMLDKYGKPIRVSKIINKGTDSEYLGTVRRWAYAYDRYGVDHSEDWACWIDKDEREYALLYNGKIRRN